MLPLRGCKRSCFQMVSQVTLQRLATGLPLRGCKRICFQMVSQVSLQMVCHSVACTWMQMMLLPHGSTGEPPMVFTGEPPIVFTVLPLHGCRSCYQRVALMILQMPFSGAPTWMQKLPPNGFSQVNLQMVSQCCLYADVNEVASKKVSQGSLR